VGIAVGSRVPGEKGSETRDEDDNNNNNNNNNINSDKVEPRFGSWYSD